jgi:hypothetical protein
MRFSLRVREKAIIDDNPNVVDFAFAVGLIGRLDMRAIGLSLLAGLLLLAPVAMADAVYVGPTVAYPSHCRLVPVYDWWGAYHYQQVCQTPVVAAPAPVYAYPPTAYAYPAPVYVAPAYVAPSFFFAFGGGHEHFHHR